ncbi:MAG: hypothetical protein ABSD92_01340 [Candidatus Bathyarchaeia archaeon]|jgi:hypothetical protein
MSVTEKRSGINQDERRAKSLALEFLASLPNYTVALFELRWTEFLKEKVRYGNPKDIADEFLKKYGEL